MRPLKFQRAYLWRVQQLWFLLMISISGTTTLQEIEGDKTYNLKIGFDLTRGSQGASSLRIRNFQEGQSAEGSHPALRAGSPANSGSSNEEVEDEKKKEVPKVAVEMKAAEDSVQSESEESDGDRRQRSTKGLRADEFEPQGPEGREPLDQESLSENSN